MIALTEYTISGVFTFVRLADLYSSWILFWHSLKNLVNMYFADLLNSHKPNTFVRLK